MRSSVLDQKPSLDMDVHKSGHKPSYQTRKPKSPPYSLIKVFTPAEGWLALILLTIALYSVAYSIVEAKWVSNSPLLYWSPAVGLLVGLLISKTPRAPQPVLHVGACLVGHWLAIWLTSVVAYHISWIVLLAGLREAFTGNIAAGSVISAERLFFFYLTFLTYFLGYFGSWLIYRAHLPWLVALVYCSILLVNLNYVKQDLLFLVVILVGSLMLLIARVRLASQVYQWKREGLHTDHAWLRSITWRCMQIAALLAVLSLCLSGLLPAFQQTQVGKQFWDNINNAWTNIINGHVSLENPSGVLQAYQEPANFFGDQLTITGSVRLPVGEVLNYRSSDTAPHYLEGFTFDTFNGHTWTSSLTQENSRFFNADEALPLDARVRTHSQVTVTVSLVQPPEGTKPYIFGPAQPLKFDIPTIVYNDGTAGMWVQGSPLTKGQAYNVLAEMPSNSAAVLASVPLPEKAPQVWHADRKFPILNMYYMQRPRDLSPQVSILTKQLTANTADAYTALKSIEHYFGDQKTFTYSVDNPPIPDNIDVVDWLLQQHRGYCTYYASAMAIMGRLLNIPTRIANGFSNGHYDQQRQKWVAEGTDAHSWVQAYFPAHGWVNFDPTPGYSLDATQQLPTQATPTPVAAKSDAKPTPQAQATSTAKNDGQVIPPMPSSTAPAHSTSSAVNQTVLIWLSVVVLVLSVLVLLAAFVRHWWRNLYAHSTLIAGLFWRFCWITSRAGLSPKPWQTPYEYSSQLSEHLFQAPSRKDIGSRHLATGRVYMPNPNESNRNPLAQNNSPFHQLTELFVRDRWGAPYAVPQRQEEQQMEQLWPTLRNTALFQSLKRVAKGHSLLLPPQKKSIHTKS